MNSLNAFLTSATDWLLTPMASWPPLATLLVVSAVAGVLMAIGFRYTSNQQALGRAVDRGNAEVLAIKLFKDELGGTFRSLIGVLKFAGLRLVHSLPPMIVMIIPFVLVLSQLGLRFEHRPLEEGESALVELRLADGAWSKYQDTQIETSSGIEVETRPLRDATDKTIYWRIEPHAAGAEKLTWRLGDELIEKQVAVVGDEHRLTAVSACRPGPSMWHRLLYPGEPGFAADAPVREIIVAHPRRSTPVFGFDVPWWLTFFIVSILAAIVVRPVVKVRF